MQVVAFALEQVVLLEADLDVQVAWRTAVVPGSPLPVLRMRMPSSMPAGIFTSSVLLFLSLPCPWQVAQRLGNDLAGAVALRAGLLHAEETLAHLHRT